MGGSQSHTRAAHLQARRLRAIQWVAGGASQADVARRLGVTREAVRQWVEAWHHGGRAALAPRPTLRRRRVDLVRVADALARAMRSTTHGVLTTWRVLDLIKRAFGVAYSASSVRAILTKLGFSYSRKTGWRSARVGHARKEPGIRAS